MERSNLRSKRKGGHGYVYYTDQYNGHWKCGRILNVKRSFDRSNSVSLPNVNVIFNYKGKRYISKY